jgi:hypothetical protein
MIVLYRYPLPVLAETWKQSWSGGVPNQTEDYYKITSNPNLTKNQSRIGEKWHMIWNFSVTWPTVTECLT